MGRDIHYLKSAQWSSDYPKGDLPEIAVTGRSNAGKSSFLNQWAQSAIAKVSNTPGKTRLLNFFEVPEKYRWVDLPGYGYAARGHGEREDWVPMIEQYLSLRENLVGALLVMDIRRDWTEDESALRDFLNNHGKNLCVVATKIDKLRPKELAQRMKKLEAVAQCHVFAVSNLKFIGADEVEDFCFKNWVRPYLEEQKRLAKLAKEEAKKAAAANEAATSHDEDGEE